MVFSPTSDAAPSLRASVTRSVRQLIVDGELAPGDRLVERRLAERLGVSRVPVREALQALEREGFAEQRPPRGLVVRHLDAAEVAMLFEVRSALEGVLARRLVEVVSDDDLARLQAVVDDTDRLGRAGLTAQAVARNAEFHDVLVELADSPVLAAVVEPVAGRLAWMLSQHAAPTAMNDEHQRVVDALAQRDADAVARVLAEHLESSRTALAAARLPRREAT